MQNVVINITEAPSPAVTVNVNDTLQNVQITIAQGGGGGGAAAATQAEVNAGVIANKYVAPLTFENAAKWATKFDNPTGAVSDYLDGTGAPQPFPSIPAQLTAGTDISIVANAINNTAPDQIVSLTAGTGIGISGTYPNFTIDNTLTAGIPKGTAAGTDTYTTTIAGVSSYADGDAYLIRFTNGNTTSATLNINSLGAKSLFRNNDGALIGGDIWDGGEMLCIYNTALNGFQCIGTSPNSLFAYVTNAEAVAITKGQVVYAFGAQGDRLTVKLANNTSDATSARTLGVVYNASIGANQKGIIMIQGELDNLSILPTSTWSDGDIVYLGATAGSITPTKPYAPNHLVYVATVITANNGNAGRMYVRVQNGYEMDELHDVSAQNPNPNDGLFYNSGTGLWTARAGTNSDVGLGNVDNTSDANKPISTATQTALNLKQDTIVVGKDVALSAGVTGATLTLVKSILIPANTFAANNVAFIKGLVTKTGTTNNVTLTAWVHTAASAGGIQIITAGTTTGSHRSFMLERDLDILVANGTGNGTRHAAATTSVITDTTPLGAAFATSAIDWTTAKYINFFLQQTGAGADTSFLSGCYVLRY